MTKVLKSKEERLKEGISLLKQILDLVHDAELEAYLELKRVITEWIQTGKAWDGKIEFPSEGRTAELSLPRSATLAATLAYKFTRT